MNFSWITVISALHIFTICSNAHSQVTHSEIPNKFTINSNNVLLNGRTFSQFNEPLTREKRAQNSNPATPPPDIPNLSAPATNDPGGDGKSAQQLKKEAKKKSLKAASDAKKAYNNRKADAEAKFLAQKNFPDFPAASNSRFEVKHTLLGLSKGGQVPSSSFETLSNPVVGLEHLMDLNRRIFRGDILPFSAAETTRWIDKAPDKKVTIVDSDVGDLTKAIIKTIQNGRDFQNENGKRLENKNNNYWTENPQRITEYRFEHKKDLNGNIIGVDVHLDQFDTRVSLAVDKNDKLTHFEGSDTDAVASKTVHLGMLSIADLETQANLNQKFYEDTVPFRQQVDPVGKPSGQWVLDSTAGEYKKPQITDIPDVSNALTHSLQKLTIADPSSSNSICPGSPTGRRKRSTGSSCIVFNKPTDDADTEIVISDDKIVNDDDPRKNVDQPEKTKVEEIQGNKFVEEYDGMDSRSKQQIAEITKKNKNKVITDNPETTKKLNKIIELEDMKSHSNKVDYSKSFHATGDVPDIAHVYHLDPFTTRFNLMTNTKISKSKFVRGLAAIAGSKIGSKLFKGADKVANPVGKFLLVKNIIKGIQSEDYTSLGITGAKLGLDFGIDKIISHGTKVFKATGKISKFTKVVGKWGGPFSAAIDVGLSVWGICKAVDRLNNPNASKFERNEAIADIVQDSIDIAVTTAVTVGSLAFPPFAPIFATVGVVLNLLATLSVGLYKASNHVDSLKDKIGLLDFEKHNEYWRYLIGQDTSHYLDSLIFIKTANTLITGEYEEILRNNSNMFGIVFPSRTFNVSRECTLYFQSCQFSLRLGTSSNCVYWRDKIVVGNKCHYYDDCLNYYFQDHSDDWNSLYNPHIKKCINDEKTLKRKNKSGMDRNHQFILECRCPTSTTISSGAPEANSLVDFRKKGYFWPQRAIPDNLKRSEFKCRPNTASDYGYQFSARETKYEYKCKNAIAIIDKSRVGKNDTYFSIDLGEGIDEVYMSDLSMDNNIFRVEDGVKTFTGGSGVDQFFIIGECKSIEGFLDGGDGDEDSVIISKSCSPSKPIRISLDSNNTLTMKTDDTAFSNVTTNSSTISIGILNVESIIGREGLVEIVNATCTIRSLMLQGGNSSSNPDEISIPSNNQSSLYNLTIQVKGHTKIQSNALHGEITIVVQRSNETSFLADIILAPTISHKLLLDAAASEIEPINQSSNNTKQNLFSFKNRFNNQTFTLRFDSGVNSASNKAEDKLGLLLTELQGEKSMLSSDEEGNYVVVHQLVSQHGKTGNRKWSHRLGCPSISNEFHLISGNWSVKGGSHSNDLFYFFSEFSGAINGGGGLNTLKIIGSNPESIFHLWDEEDTHSSKRDFNQSIKVINVRRILGRPGTQDKLTLSGFPPQSRNCQDGILISLEGGKKDLPDLITVNNNYNNVSCFPPLKIAVMSYTIVQMSLMNGQLFYPVVFFICSDATTDALDFKFDLDMTSYNNDTNFIGEKLLFYIELNPSNLSEATVKQEEEIATRTSFLSNLNLQFLDNQILSLNFTNNTSPVSPNILFLEEGQVIAQLVIHERKGIVVHSLDNNEHQNITKIRSGALGVSNHFYLNGGKWKIVGGQKDDTFNLMSDKISGSVDGGSSGDNQLVLGPELALSKPILIDLLNDYQYLNIFETSVSLKSLNIILGRTAQQEIILCGRDTKYVDGGGGSSPSKTDLIVISDNDKSTRPFNITVKGMNYTNIQNNATNGHFKYILSSDSTSVNSSAGYNATELLQLNLPMETVRSVDFTKTTEISGKLRVQMKSGFSHSLQIPFLSPNSHEIKTIQILQENKYTYSEVVDSSIKCDVRVRPDESIYTSIVLRSNVHVDIVNSLEGISGIENNFIVELHLQTHLKSIKGSSEDDHFWIYSAKSLDSLDGGGEGDEGNSLHIFDYFFHGQELLIDLGIQFKEGSIIPIKDGKANDQKAIRSLQNIQIFHGRPNMHDKVLVTCDTSFLANAEEILITDDECDYYSLTMKVTSNLIVDFKPDVYFEGTFVYNFDEPFTIVVKGLESISTTDETYSKHVFRLNFLKVAELEDLRFNGTHLVYRVKENKVHSFEIISEPGNLEEFYPHDFVTGDNMVVQITRFGTILLTLGSTWSKEIELDLVKDIQLKYVPEMEDTARRLGVTIIAQTNTDYLTAGYVSNSEDAGDHNILTNTPLRSHLIGCGSNRTVYEIVSLDSDVFIYPGINSNNPTHILDMTDIVAAIRLKTDTKFVPTVEENGTNLVISITGYESEFPGRITIMNGVKEAPHLDILFNSAIVKLIPRSMLKETRRKREINHEEDLNNLWSFHPKKIIVPAGSVFTISPEDLEEGHEIALADSDGESKRNFKLVRDGNDLYMTTLGSLTEWASEPEDLTTIVLAEYFDAESKPELFPGEINLSNDTLRDRGQPITKPKFVDVSFNLQENETIYLNNSEMVQIMEDTTSEIITPLETEQLESWEDLLVQSETEVLENFPEVTHRVFNTRSPFVHVQIFQYKFKIHKEYMKFIYIGASIIGCIFVACILCVIRHLRTWTTTMEVNKEKHSSIKHNCKGIEPLDSKNLS